MTDITEILRIVWEVLAAIVSIVLIPFLRSKLSETKRKEITAWVSLAVQAAEEAERAGLIDKKAKYQYALTVLRKRGVTFDADTVQAMIDSACWELFNRFKETESEEPAASLSSPSNGN